MEEKVRKGSGRDRTDGEKHVEPSKLEGTIARMTGVCVVLKPKEEEEGRRNLTALDLLIVICAFL